MKMKFTFSRLFALGAILLTTLVSAQAQTKVLTLEDAILGRHLYPSGLNQLSWVDDFHFSQVIDKEGEPTIQIAQIEPTHNGLLEYVTRTEIEKALVEQHKTDSLKRLPRVSWISLNEMRFYHDGGIYKYNRTTKKAAKLNNFDPKQMQSPDMYAGNFNIAYTHDDNLFVIDKGTVYQVTQDGGKGIVYGEAVHRSEFGIVKGTFWNDAGDQLAFYRMDETMVTEYPLYNLSTKPATPNEIRYPVAGDPSHHVTIGIYNVAANKTVYLKTGEPKEQYLTNISWGPKGQFIYVAVVNREQNHMWLKQFNANTGDFVKTLFEEKNDKYVEPEHGLTFLPSAPEQFIWWSERSGYNHLYLYNTNGELIRQITKGQWIITDLHGFDTKSEKIFVSTTKESPLNNDLYCVSIKNGKMLRLTTSEGSHNVQGSTNNLHFFDNFSNTVTPLDIRLIDAEGRLLENLHENENPLSEYKLGQMEMGSIKAKDGETDLYYRVFKPIDFDPNKKYPVVVYLYGGPHLQLITNSWLGGANLWYQYLAQQGYVVFSIDNRGSANRGFAFESAVHRQLGTLEMEDQLAGVEWLKSQTYVDAKRMGIHGWSFGGFMTTTLMTRSPGTFKVGVAGGPVIDWAYYEIMYTERYMDSPTENPEGYKTANLLNYTDKLEGKLLMIHGSQDNVVLWQHSMMYMQKNIEDGNTNLDYFIYPHHEHNVRGKDRLHLYQKITDYLFDNL
ncbi:MAG: dipeptidyl-peptidase-4 [Bacteroidia bacterium]|jgi:dipeptidyl-peptidase-4